MWIKITIPAAYAYRYHWLFSTFHRCSGSRGGLFEYSIVSQTVWVDDRYVELYIIPTRCIIIMVSDEDRIINRQRIRVLETVVRRRVGGLQGGIGGVEHCSVCKVLPNNKNAEKENIIKHVYIQMHWRLWNK